MKFCHLPSVHVRNEHGDGFDYEENLEISDRGAVVEVVRLTSLIAIEADETLFAAVTRDRLCAEEADGLLNGVLKLLMQKGNREAEKFMEERGRAEFARQLRIADGLERACAGCGCSETRSCSGGCVWATEALCSRCVS